MKLEAPALFVYVDGAAPWSVPLPSAPLVLGRDPGCDLVLPSQFVSRRHCEIRPHGKGYELVDIGARNRVTINGVELDHRRGLTSGDIIQLGDVSVEFWDGRKDANPTAVLAVQEGPSSADRARALRAARHGGQGDAAGAPMVLATSLRNAERIAGVSAAATTVFGVHRAMTREELERHDAVELDVMDDGCTARFATALAAVHCALAITGRAARYNYEHPSLPLQVSAAVTGVLPSPGERILHGRLLVAATTLLARARPLQVLVTDVVAGILRGHEHLETHAQGTFGMGDEERRPLFAIARRQALPAG